MGNCRLLSFRLGGRGILDHDVSHQHHHVSRRRRQRQGQRRIIPYWHSIQPSVVELSRRMEQGTFRTSSRTIYRHFGRLFSCPWIQSGVSDGLSNNTKRQRRRQGRRQTATATAAAAALLPDVSNRPAIARPSLSFLSTMRCHI